MIKSQHIKPYNRDMRSNKVECSTVAGPYCTMHDVNLLFCMPAFYIRKITSQQFHVDKNEGKPDIGYDTIIGRDLMVQLGL